MILPKKNKKNSKRCGKIMVAAGLSTVMLFSNTTWAAASLLKMGSRGDDVKSVQQRLKELGYYSYSEITGYYGSITRSSVIKFQAAKGVSQDGIVGPVTKALLFQDYTEPSRSGNTSSAARPVLKMGSTGSSVKELQSLLKDRGYYSSVVDGVFGAGTKSAVMSFQKAVGLTADGIAGSKTWDSLVSVSRSSGVLKQGDKGLEVYELQTLLKNKGFYTLKIDGEFGPYTEKALKEYQQAAGLIPDGIAGAKTFASLTSSTSPSRGSESGGNAGSAPSSGHVEMIHWSQVDAIWPRTSNASNKVLITDVATGISFYAVRSGGTNHADVETASAADTAILKQLYGGGFSWDRRAVIVHVGGRKLAASMAGMPHAGRDDKPNRAMVSGRSGGYGYGSNLDAVKGNNMNGVFDIHFYGSKTHGTNRVDEKHQSMVKAAAGLK